MRLSSSSLVLTSLLLAYGCSDSGISRVEYTEEFTQADSDVVVDVLFVVDNSATMDEEQTTLDNSFGALTDLMGDLDADFHIGVITTDTDDEEQAGRLQGSVPVMTPDTPDLATAFAEAAHVGTQGYRYEMGLEAVRLAMTERVADGSNAGFFREEAVLEVVIVSDEDDHSTLEVKEYLAAFQEAQVESSMTFSGILGDLPDGCISPTASAAPGTRYFEVIDATGGYDGSICLQDWTPLLEEVGFALAGVGEVFPLEGVPDPTTIEVRVDDVLMPEVTPERPRDAWTFDPAQNAIVFDGFSVPRPGQLVNVQYFK